MRSSDTPSLPMLPVKLPSSIVRSLSVPPLPKFRPLPAGFVRFQVVSDMDTWDIFPASGMGFCRPIVFLLAGAPTC